MKKEFLELIKNASTLLPNDVVEAIATAKNQEQKNSKGELAFDVILKNLELAKNNQIPICQDTGFPTFFVKIPESSKFTQEEIRNYINQSLSEATEKGYLRPNAVNSLTGENSGDNTGIHYPKIIFEQNSENRLEIDLIIKGGGSENVSTQVSLPMKTSLGLAERNLEGVKKAAIDIVKNIKGKGCSPGILSLHIGGDRSEGFSQGKKNLLEKIGTANEDLALQKLEAEILEEANKLGIGPMGFGGKTTLLDVKISSSHRHPASFFVTAVYNCWAMRRGKIVFDENGKLIENSFEESAPLQKINLNTNDFKKLKFPASEKEIRNLKVGDVVLVEGRIFTGRDAVHSYAMKNELEKDLANSAVYHCGPVVIKNEKNEWEIKAAGPTTSAREEVYEADFIKKTGIRGIIGKGGMGKKTSKALKELGGIYLHAIGGAGVFYSQNIKKINGVDYLEFGTPEAMWELEVENFLCVVTMDSHGNTL